MSDLISRDPKVLALLFTEELYQISSDQQLAAQPAATIPASPSFDYLGENNRFFLLLVDEPGQQHLDSVHLEALSKILQAKGLELKDVAILNLHHYPDTNFAQLRSFFSCSKVCLFGIAPDRLQLPAFPSNEPGVVEEVKILTTFALQELLQTQHKKVAFWNAMKIF
jgi:hypothetical protein